MNNAEQSMGMLSHAQHGLISRAQARAAGVSESTIERRLRSGTWKTTFRGVYLLSGCEMGWEHRVMGGTLAAGEGALAFRRAAATLVEIPGIPRWVEIVVPRGRQVRVKGLDVHESMVLPDEHRHQVRGIPVTSVARTLVDLAYVYPKRVDKMLGFCLTHKLCTRAEVQDCLKVLSGRGGSGLLAIAGALARRPTSARPIGSDFEWDLYAALKDNGVRLPQAQFKIVLGDGTVRYVDFAYEEEKLALEADSYIWHADRLAWERDKAREHELIALGWTILPITWHLLHASPAKVADLVRRSLDARH